MSIFKPVNLDLEIEEMLKMYKELMAKPSQTIDFVIDPMLQGNEIIFMDTGFIDDKPLTKASDGALRANLETLLSKVNKHSELSKFVIEYNLKKFKDLYGFQEANRYIEKFDLRKLYQIRPFRK